MAKARGVSYRDAGVSIDEADRTLSAIKRMARGTFTKGVLTDIGSFGACFELPKMKNPVLISSVDGVGTKLKLAFVTGKHDTVGEDLVNHSVNDIAVQGALPLFFMDYLAMGKLEAHVAAQVISGMARGCKQNGCALIGGETAEMPGMYQKGEYDLAGTIVGAAEKSKVITGDRIRSGDMLLALPSTGLHTNGYSLARTIAFDILELQPDSYVPELGKTIAEEFLTVHRSYLKSLRRLHEAGLLKAAVHITGGGITDNMPRVLPKDTAVRIDLKSWIVPPVFEFIRAAGKVPENDWRRTFNLGVGMIFVVSSKRADDAVALLLKMREKPFLIGEVIKQSQKRARVEYT